MRRPWYAVLFCVLLIQRSSSQQASCKSDLGISIDDLLRAIGNGQLNQQGNVGQDVCGCQQNASQNFCGCQQNLLNQPFPISNQPSYNQIPFQPSFQVNQGGFGSQQPSFPFSQPNLFGSQSCGQPSISLNQPFGSGQQSSIPFSQPSPFSSQNCGFQPSISLNQPFGCSQPPIFGNQPFGSLSQPGCGNQLSSRNNLCGYQPLSLNQQPSSFTSQPSSPSQSCGSIPLARPFNLKRGSNNQQSSTTLSTSGSTQQCQSQSKQSTSQCSSELQNANVVNIGVGNIGNNVASVIPNALLQAPPFGIFFEGDSLIIEGAVQVCGSLPFNSAVQISGMMPASGFGNVQYVCNDGCQL